MYLASSFPEGLCYSPLPACALLQLLSLRLLRAPLPSAVEILMRAAPLICPAPALPLWKEIPILDPSLFPAKSFSRAAGQLVAWPLIGFAAAPSGVKAIRITRAP